MFYLVDLLKSQLLQQLCQSMSSGFGIGLLNSTTNSSSQKLTADIELASMVEKNAKRAKARHEESSDPVSQLFVSNSSLICILHSLGMLQFAN